MATPSIIGAQNAGVQDSPPSLFRSLSKRLIPRSSSSKTNKAAPEPSGRSSHPVGGRILTLRALPAIPRDNHDNSHDDGDVHDLVLRHTGTRVAYEEARRRVVPSSSRRGSISSEPVGGTFVAAEPGMASRRTTASKPRPTSSINPISTLEDRLDSGKLRRRWSRSEPRCSRPESATTTTCPLSEPLTLRDVLMKRILASQTRQRHKPQPVPVSSRSMTNGSRTPIERPLTPVQTRELLNAMDNASKLALDVPVARVPVVCAVCSEPRYAPTPTSAPGQDRSEDATATKATAAIYMSTIASQCPSLDSDSDSNFLEDIASRLGRMACCQRHVCRSCLSRSIVEGIEKEWSHDVLRQGPGWIRCPAETCDAVISLYTCNIRDVLRTMSIPDVELVARQFVVAGELRSALRGMSPPPTEREIRKGLKFHNDLVRLGCAWPLLQGNNAHCDVGEVKVKRVTVDFVSKKNGAGATTERLQVPLFTHLLKLPRMVKECSICTETYHDLQPPNFETSNAISRIDEKTNGQASWEEAFKIFPGSWTWQISTFPSKDMLPLCAEAHPDIHICRPCLAKHIDTQLELHGHAIVPCPNIEQTRGITCPVRQCQDRKLTHLEMSKLARPATFARYDRLCMLNSISTDPGFRWCLRRGCESGAIYESNDTARAMAAPSSVNERQEDENTAADTTQQGNAVLERPLPTLPPQPPPRKSSRRFSLATQSHLNTTTSPAATSASQNHDLPAITHITCHACSFEMCFTCQTPWHTSLTCTESQALLLSSQSNPSARLHHSQTTAWLSQHTKRCPNPLCSAPIEKGDGCFHMTCSACQFQFCWECLADWRGVVVDGRFVREGHKEGCYFRGENAVPPTQIMGVSVERGLRRTRGLFR